MSESAGKTSAKVPASASAQHARPRSPGPAPALGGFGALWALQGMAGNRAVSGALSGGAPLPGDVRGEMEARFGADFAEVRVHDDTSAHHSATGLASHAYTHGEHIVFNANRFAPHTGGGKRLLAHELAHVVQQRRGGAVPALDPQAPHEQAADHAADAVMAGSAPVVVAGATGVGVACDNWFTDKYKALKEEIPPEYRAMVRTAVKGGANAAVNTVGAISFVPPPITEGLGETIVKSLDDLAEGGGAEAVTENLKGLGRDKVLDAIGTANGVVKQVTEIVDTSLWVAQEARDLRDSAVDAAGGKGSLGGGLTRSVFDVVTLGTGPSLDAAASAADALQAAGAKDHFGRASLTAPYAEWTNELVKDVEEALGESEDEGLFTRTEEAELKTMIATQVALSFIGVEEVKIVLNAAAALGSLRGVVETMRHNKNWASDPTFWGHIIGGVLSVVGLGSSIAKPKIIQLVLKFGWVAAAVPPMAAMLVDYNAYLNGELTEEELDARLKKHFAAACNVIKDGILHVSQSGASKSPTPTGKTPAKTAAGGGDGEALATPPAKDSAAAPAAKETATTPTPQDSPVGLPPPQAPKLAPPRETARPAPVADDANVVPLEQGRALTQSKASKKLESALAKQPADEAGSVTPLRPRRKPAPPPPPDSEPQAQPLPVEQKLAVGQTHGADGGAGTATGQKPSLRLVPDADAPRASVSDGGGSGSPPGRATSPGAPSAPQVGKGPGGAGGSGGKRGGTRTQKKSPPKPDDADLVPLSKSTSDPIEARLAALKVPKAQRKAVAKVADLVRKRASTDPDSAEELLTGLEKRFGVPVPPSKSEQVSEDLDAVQDKLYAERTPSGKHTQSPEADKRALQDQMRPSAKQARKAKVGESERVGEAGGRAQADKEGIAVQEWDTPQKWKGEYGQGPDALGKRGDRELILEFKGESSALSTSKRTGVVQMSNEWVGRKIAELHYVGDMATAARLRQAAHDGKLQGVVYSTKTRKGGEKTSRLKSHQLRDRLSNEAIRDSGLIDYAPSKVEAAYQQRLQELQASEAAGDVRRLP